MDFNLTEDRQMLVDTLRRFLAERYPIATRHAISASELGFSRELWGALAELGVPSALFSEALGGFGGAGFDIMAVFESLGRGLVVEPFLGTLMAGRILAKHPELVAALLSGAETAALAAYEPQSRYDLSQPSTRAEKRGAGWVLDGTKAVVPQIEGANRIVVSAKTAAGVSLFVIPRDAKGITITGYPLVDGGRGGELRLEGVEVGADAEVGGLPELEAAVAAGIVALSSEAIGIMDVMSASTLDYLRTRMQFGVPIGKFQALQHRMATVALEIEQARSSVINAAAALDSERPLDRDRAVSAAKFTIGRVGTIVVEECIQLHGGIGMTWELALPHYAKRLTMIGHQLGDEDHHLERYAKLSAA